MKENYDLKMQEIIKSLDKKPTLLLHSCCGPCSTAVLERLVEFFDVSVFFFNPNITESEEYNLRLETERKFLSDKYQGKVPLIEGRYFSREFFEAVKGLEKEAEGGKRCEVCFKMRLLETAKYAKENGFEYFCSTLTVSPHKNAELINELGEKIASDVGVKILPSDFKKQNGFKRSTEISNEYELYRQNYCGCLFSKYTNLIEESV